MTDEGLCRVGWSTLKGGRELGGLFVDCMRDMVCCPAVSHVLQVRMVRALGLVVQGRNHSAVSLMIMARWDNCPCTHNWQSSCNRTLDRKTDKLSYTILQGGPTHESYPSVFNSARVGISCICATVNFTIHQFSAATFMFQKGKGHFVRLYGRLLVSWVHSQTAQAGTLWPNTMLCMIQLWQSANCVSLYWPCQS